MLKDDSANRASDSYTHSDAFKLRFAVTNAEILACFPAMHELRPHLIEGDFVARVRRQQQGGYQLAYAFSDAEPGKVASACGFRIQERLFTGVMMYIDDLVTVLDSRGKGYGGRLLDAVISYASEMDCAQVHLDSGFQRYDAHRLYLNYGFLLTSHHFARIL